MTAQILILDDEPKWLAFAKDDLGTKFEVEVAPDLETTLMKLKKKSYDLIIASSCRLDVLKAITEKHPEERVVVATGQPTAREAINTYRLGALDYFAKDFSPEVITAKINEALQKTVKSPA